MTYSQSDSAGNYTTTASGATVEFLRSDATTEFSIQQSTTVENTQEPNFIYLPLALLFLAAVVGNLMVILSVAIEKKLRDMATNHFIASLAVSDLLVGAVVMPFAIYLKINNNKWRLGHGWCRFHLSTAVFATTASIINLVAISIDRYFAIIFPTEYQRHSTRAKSVPYTVMVWLMSAAVTAPVYLERTTLAYDMCWLEDPQYMIMSSLLSFFLPASVVCMLYVKIFRRIRRHLHLFWAGKRGNANKRNNGGGVLSGVLPQVIVEEVRSRCNSRVESSPSRGNSPTRSASQPDINNATYVRRLNHATPLARIRSGSTLVPPPLSVLNMPVPDPPSRRPSADCGNNIMNNNNYIIGSFGRDLTAFSADPEVDGVIQLTVPNLHKKHLLMSDLCRSTSGISSPGTASSMTSASSDDRKSSMYSYGSSLDDECELEQPYRANSSRKCSAATLDRVRREDSSDKLSIGSSRKTSGGSLMQSSGNKLRRIAQQVTRAVRQKRRESQAIRRETRATRIVAAILIVFILCWLPYFCSLVYRGTCLGLADSCRLNYWWEIQIYLITSWLGYAHSCFNCVIYTFLNKTFRSTFKRLLCIDNNTQRLVCWKK